MSVLNNIWRPNSMVIVFLSIEGSEKNLKASQFFRKEGLEWKDEQIFESIQEIVKYFGTNKAYHLSVEGTGVLTRRMLSKPNFQEDLIVSGNKNEFVFSYFDDLQNTAVSFFRVALIQSFIDDFERCKSHLVGVSSGAIPILINSDVIADSTYSIKMNGGRIEEFKKGNQERFNAKIQSSGAIVTYNHLLSKSIYECLVNQTGNLVLGEGLNFDGLKSYSEHKKFNFFGVLITLFILIILCINFIFQGSLNSRIAQQELDLSIGQSNLTQIEQMDLEVIRKSELIRASGIMSNNFVAYYLDEIGNSVPNDIHLKEMDVFPLKKKLKSKHKVEVDKSEILVHGTTKNNEVLDDWIEELSDFDWVESVKLIGYLVDEKQVAQFDIKLKIYE